MPTVNVHGVELHYRFEGPESDTVQGVRRMIQATPVEGFCGCAAAVRDMDNRPLLDRIMIPAHIVVGRQDQLTTVEDAQFLQERMAQATLTVLEDASHLCNLEQPTAFNTASLSHLRRDTR